MCSKLVLCFILSCGGMVCCFDTDKECMTQHPDKRGAIKAKTLAMSGHCSYICMENDVEIGTDNLFKPDNTPCGDLRESKVCLEGKCVTLYDISYCEQKMGVKTITVTDVGCMVVCGIKDDDSKSTEFPRPNGFPCLRGNKPGKCKSLLCKVDNRGSASLVELDDEPVASTRATLTTQKPSTPTPHPLTMQMGPPSTTPKPSAETLEMGPATPPTPLPTPVPTPGGTFEPALTHESVVDPVSDFSDIYTVDTTSLCKQQYRSEATEGRAGNSTYGCMYFCFYGQTQLNQEPLFAPDETPCAGREPYGCSNGFCQRKSDIQICKYHNRKHDGNKIRVTGALDTCDFICEMVHVSGQYADKLAVRDGQNCKNATIKTGKCKGGDCIEELNMGEKNDR